MLDRCSAVAEIHYLNGQGRILGHSPTLAEAREGKACSQITQDKITHCVGLNRARKLAPLYIVCSGSVRPRLTCINEGLSMKKELIERYGIPGHEILVDATSEHTYSNFMNTVLLARAAKMPPGTKLAVFLVPADMGAKTSTHFASAEWQEESTPRLEPKTMNLSGD
ncbi:hypothetical protein B0H17DRAFT_1135953 [Mycena rosella]|uniref:DUF218 domain-containing protein n=1 Tax=Mycena rosella TaxID=1033263 RepID=A0AAD7GF02_MYCRO|nr:hypothetical protein B0H17DRAFT_1135953 [Mycena rosella]